MNLSKANLELELGRKTLIKKQWLWSPNKHEQAIVHFEKAAHLYKNEQAWIESGNAYKLKAESELALKTDASKSYRDAFLVLSKVCLKDTSRDSSRDVSIDSFKEAIDCMMLSIESLLNQGQFYQMAKGHQELAKFISTSKPNEIELIIEHYMKAIQYYETEHYINLANKCKLKVAELYARESKLLPAITLWEDVAIKSLDNDITKFTAKRYFFLAGLAHLAVGDMITMKKALDRYTGLDISFNRDRDHCFLESLIKSIDDQDITSFSSLLTEYDTISPLDPLKVKLLLQVKKQLETGITDHCL